MTDRIAVESVAEDPSRATIVERSLCPEIDAIDADRTTATLDRDGGTLEMTIEATDPVALRAGANSWLGLLEVAERVADD